MYDFYSDTKSLPTHEMLCAIAEAQLGDEQKGEDPTTRALEERVAKLLGKEAAVFMISGTMCNEIAVRVHCRPGDEVILDETAHLLNFECGGPSALSGVVLRTVKGDRGIYSAKDVKHSVRPNSRYMPKSRMVLVEQTANFGGGAIWPLETINEVVDEAKKHDLITHMDGARLMNAVVKTGISAAEYAKGFDSVWIDFSKGLGAPCGAVLAGSKEFIEKAWREKQAFGGAMRQSGVLASTCLYALDHHMEQQSSDNQLASFIGEKLLEVPQITNVLPVDTNIVIFDLDDTAPTAQELVNEMKQRGILLGAFGERRVRAVTCLNVNQKAGIELINELTDYLS
ncbi:threonine aldolase family protein [Aliamphritea hakodatensis]|uniref:threonine aldolase family protein n=1 Tax=Aliamphritea hakodatensis TaxID=2895352 RepID=UPI0022FD959D|nr:threonine aldolase family protein [Aliamphritea hakodatensis]